MDKRGVERHDIDASTVCGHLTTLTDEKHYNGKMLNYSEGGMCIESRADFKNGGIVFIRVDGISSNFGSPSPIEGFRMMSLAEIKWSKPSDDAGKTLFGMSVVKY